MLAKLKLYLLPLFILSSFVAIFVGISKATDQTITCDANGCSGPGEALFNESNAAPGGSATKSLEIKNERSKDISVSLFGTKQSPTDNILLDVVDVEIEGADTPIPSRTLANFLSGSAIPLGNISAGASKEIKISLNFQSSAGNDYQDKIATFDILVNVTGDDEEGIGGGVSATPTPTSTTGGASGGTPAIFGGATKAFKAELLGISDEGELKGEETGAVEGLACSDKNYIWWLPLAIQLIVGIAIVKFFRKKPRKIAKNLIIIILGLAIISQAVHEWLGCNCATGVWCPRYWVFNLLVLVISLLFWRFLRKRK